MPFHGELSVCLFYFNLTSPLLQAEEAVKVLPASPHLLVDVVVAITYVEAFQTDKEHCGAFFFKKNAAGVMKRATR